jgi:hypothetical protein
MPGSRSSDPPADRPESVGTPRIARPSSAPPHGTDELRRRTRSARRTLLLLLAVCAAPVIASYLAYFVIRPGGQTNYSELIQPPRAIPAGLALTDLHGGAVSASTLKGQWLLVVVAGATCDARCENYLWIQRQLREALGAQRDRLDKVWLIDDAAPPRARTLEAIGADAAGDAPTVLRASAASIGAWLQPAAGQRLEDHLYVVDPRGDWMMRVPVDPEPARLKRDIDKLLRASAGWDRPGR